MVHEVPVVLARQGLPELDHRPTLVIERLGRFDVVPAVTAQHVHLVMGQVCSDLERQILHVVHPHVELQDLETGGPCPVVEVVDLEQVQLLHDPVTRFDPVCPAIPLDDCHGLVVKLTGRCPLHHVQHVDDRIIEPEVIEPHHPRTTVPHDLEHLDDLRRVVRPVADLIRPSGAILGILDVDLETVGKCFAVIDEVSHYDPIKSGIFG